MRADDSRIARHFDLKAAEVEAEERPEPVPITARLLDLVAAAVSEDQLTILDLGCGTGADALRLLESGARWVTGIDLSSTSIEVARRRALEAGIGPERARFDVGDVARASLQPHDWVILDRVICCYGDADRLLSNALSAVTRGLAFSVPESRGWRGLLNSISWWAENLWKSIFTGHACPGYVHDVRSIEESLETAGFSKTSSDRIGLWYAAVFETGTGRAEPGAPSPRRT